MTQAGLLKLGLWKIYRIHEGQNHYEPLHTVAQCRIQSWQLCCAVQLYHITFIVYTLHLVSHNIPQCIILSMSFS